MHLTPYKIALAVLMLGLCASPADARDIKLRSGSYLCPDYGWFEHADDAGRARACAQVHCDQAIAVMTMSSNYAYVCNQVRTIDAQARREMPLYVCAYASIRDMVDGDGKYQTSQTLFADVGHTTLDRVPVQASCE